ncbi:UNVERIFIED_CONTAM: BglG family transcription antiterminator [Streptococcus canis]
MLNTKEKMILQYLYQHRGDYSTSKVLADYLSYSDRTIRTYIKKLSSDLSVEETGFKIVSKQGFGYQLEIVDDKTYHQFLVENDLAVGLDYGDIDNRHKAILNKLIFEEEAVLFDDLADQLFVSRSTLSSDFKKIRSQLAKYQLSIESKPYRGVYILGKEQDKRHFIMDYFFGDQFHQNMTHFVGKDILSLPLSLEELTIIVLDECRNQGLKLSDYAIQNLVIHLGLAVERFQKGYRISPIDLDTVKYQKELAVAQSISERLSHRLKNIELIPDEETAYIALHLISKSMADEQSSQVMANLRQEVALGLEECDHKEGYDFLNDMSILPAFQKYQLSEDEIAYVALHFMASVERQKEKHKLNVLVICATGFGSAQMLKNRIINELGQLVAISDVIGYYDLTNDKLKDVDVIMSTIDLSNLVFNIPVQTVSVFLTEQEVLEAKKTCSKLREKHQQNQQQDISFSEDILSSSFDYYFSKENFIVLDSSDKSSLITKMIGLLAPDNTSQQKELVNLIKGRERLSSLVFDQDIAVPHPLKSICEKHQIAVAIIKNGLYWEDGFENIKLVFLVVPSIYSNEGLKSITSRIVDLVDLPNVKNDLINTNDFETFKAIFLDSKRS